MNDDESILITTCHRESKDTLELTAAGNDDWERIRWSVSIWTNARCTHDAPSVQRLRRMGWVLRSTTQGALRDPGLWNTTASR